MKNEAARVANANANMKHIAQPKSIQQVLIH